MKVKNRLKLLIALFVVMAASLIAGCSIGEPTVESFLTERNARDQYITYYANGGTFGGSVGTVTKDIYYPVDSYVITDFGDVNNLTVSRSGYVFNGWYFVELDEDGNPVYDDISKNIVKSTDQLLEASMQIPEGEHWYVCASWSLDYQLEYILVCDTPVTSSDGSIVYETGDVIYSADFGTAGYINVQDKSPMESADSTYLEIFEDIECTKPFSGKVYKPEGEDADNIKVYAKYISGIWSVVKTASDVRTMFNNSSTDTQYYIYNDIDCSTISLSPKTGEFNCTIAGNNHTLKNLKYSVSSISGGTSYAMFGTFGASASISDLTIENVTLNMTVKSGTSSLYLICLGMNDGASFENFKIDGAVFTIDYPTGLYIENIQMTDSGVFDTSNWMFGGFETDAEFIDEYAEDFVVLNAGLTINYEVVVG